jgi:hypothetical protein
LETFIFMLFTYLQFLLVQEMQRLGRLLSSTLRLQPVDLTKETYLTIRLPPHQLLAGPVRPLSSFPLLTSFLVSKPPLAPLVVPSRGQKKAPKLNK